MKKYKTYTVEEWIPYVLGIVILLIVIFAFVLGYYLGQDYGYNIGMLDGQLAVCDCSLRYIPVEDLPGGLLP